MKTQTRRNLFLRSGLALALALAVFSPVQSQSAEPAEEKKMMPMKGDDKEMMQPCKDMKEKMEEMKEVMKVQDTELAEQLAKMNSAADDKKVSLMASVVTTMVEQRAARDASMAKMKEGMMQHMMEHMKMGEESMGHCPMMEGMDKKPEGKHSEHHEKPE